MFCFVHSCLRRHLLLACSVCSSHTLLSIKNLLPTQKARRHSFGYSCVRIPASGIQCSSHPPRNFSFTFQSVELSLGALFHVRVNGMQKTLTVGNTGLICLSSVSSSPNAPRCDANDGDNSSSASVAMPFTVSRVDQPWSLTPLLNIFEIKKANIFFFLHYNFPVFKVAQASGKHPPLGTELTDGNCTA